MAEDTSLLITVLMFLGFLGAIVFIPWMIYNERKKLSLKYQRIGCLVSAVFLLCAMYFLWDSLNPSTHIERNTEEAAEPVTVKSGETAEKRFSRADFIPIMEAGVAKAFGENNYSVESDGEFVTFNIWNAHASAIFNRLYKGIDKSPDDGWTAQVNGVQKAAEDLQGLVAQYCFEEATVVVNAVDYSDRSKLLVSCNSDAVLFNAADFIERPENTDNATPEQDGDTQDAELPINDEPEDIPAPYVEPEPEPVAVKANVQTIERALLAAIPQRYQSDSMFFTDVYVNDDNTVEFMIQLDQNSGNKDAALSLAVEYYRTAKRITEDAGGQMGRYDIMILNNGSPVGDYVTDDGKTYSVIADGKVTSIDVS